MADQNMPFIEPGSEGQIHTVVFPVMKDREPEGLELLGTGFFISKAGHFVSARHVLMDVINEDLEQCGWLRVVHFVKDTEVLVRPLTRIIVNNNSDIGIGLVKYLGHAETGRFLGNRVAPLTASPPAIGSPIVSFGYPDSSRVFVREETSQIIGSLYQGTLQEVSDRPRDTVMVKYPYFRGDFEAKPSLSGAPVFDTMGRVFGVVTTSFREADGSYRISYMSRIVDLLGLRVPMPSGENLEEEELTIQQMVQRGIVILS